MNYLHKETRKFIERTMNKETRKLYKNGTPIWVNIVYYANLYTWGLTHAKTQERYKSNDVHDVYIKISKNGKILFNEIEKVFGVTYGNMIIDYYVYDENKCDIGFRPITKSKFRMKRELLDYDNGKLKKEVVIEEY